jgi:tetratricopeptide (TPR) repeat protein
MKRTISLWLGLLAFALLPVLSHSQSTQLPGKIHGKVTNPTGVPAAAGTVNLSSDGGHTTKYTFKVAANGEYSGEAQPGTYMLLFRLPETPPDKMVDEVDSVKIVSGQDTMQDIDMSRKEFIDALPVETRKQLEEIKKKNADAMKTNALVKSLNADILAARQDFKDADGAKAAAVAALGATASKADLEAKEAEIKTAKYTDAETIMLKDTGLKPDASVLWAQLGEAQLGLKKFDEAEATYKKVLDLESTAKKQNPQNQGAAEAGLGEIYARNGKIPEANAAYDAAAKFDPTKGAFYFRNEAVIFSQLGNTDAEAAAADESITLDPTQPLSYYLKGQGLISKATIDQKSGKMILPPGCAEAYQKYLDLAPNGPYANDVKGILAESNQTHASAFGTDTPSKKKK